MRRGFGYSGFGFNAPNGLSAAAAPTYTAEATALFARMTAPPDTTRKNLINAVFVALKSGPVSSSNILAKLDALYVMAAADSQAAGLNWLGNVYNLTPSGTTPPTFVADRGYTGDGLTGYLDTGFNPTTATTPQYALNSASFGCWSRTAAQGASVDMGQGPTIITNPGSDIYCRNLSDQAKIYINSATSGIGSGATATNTDGSGLFVANRSGATSGTTDTAVYRNAVSLTLASQDASTARGNANIIIGGGGGITGSTRQFSAGEIGGTLTANENTDLYNALQAYMTGVGA